MSILYDGTFEGFLSIVYSVYYDRLKPIKIVKDRLHQGLFDEVREISTDRQRAEKVLTALHQKFPPKAFARIMYTLMCDTKPYEMDLLTYIQLGFKDPTQCENIADPSVWTIHELERELFRHLHLMYGFVRFEELADNTLYAKIEPKFHVTPLLGKHFIKRLGDIPFIIHDLKRSIALVRSGQDMQLHNVADFDLPTYSKDEKKFQKLWKTFFESVSLAGRRNEKLQRNFVPLWYRAYMTEFLK
jgi:probable DNA metabolism protein